MEFAVRSPRCEVDCLTYRGVWRREYLDILVVCIWSVPWPRTWPRRCTVYSVCRWVCWGGWRGRGPREPRAVDTADDGESWGSRSKIAPLSFFPNKICLRTHFGCWQGRTSGQGRPRHGGPPANHRGPGSTFDRRLLRMVLKLLPRSIGSRCPLQMLYTGCICCMQYCYSPQRPVQYLPLLQGSRRLPLLCSCQNAEQRIAYQPQPWSC